MQPHANRDVWTPWLRELSARLKSPVRLAWTRSRKTPLALRSVGVGAARAIELRLHALFADASAEVREAVARWCVAGRRATRACRVIDEHVEEHLARTRPAPPKLEARGRHHDLASIAEDVLSTHLKHDWKHGERIPVGWGRAASSARSGLRLGSYDPDARCVRIHPVLDQSAVPRYVVSFVVFHELLHHLHPPRRDPAGRMVHHGPAFRAKELAHPDYAAIQRWERAHIGALVASARTRRPLVAHEAADEAPAADDSTAGHGAHGDGRARGEGRMRARATRQRTQLSLFDDE